MPVSALPTRQRSPITSPSWALAIFTADVIFRPLLEADHGVAFYRGERALTVVPTVHSRTPGDWNDSTIEAPSGCWRDQLTDETNKGGELGVAALLERFPMVLLMREEENL
jgi:maltooligosyltrehalose synthase